MFEIFCGGSKVRVRIAVAFSRGFLLQNSTAVRSKNLIFSIKSIFCPKKAIDKDGRISVRSGLGAREYRQDLEVVGESFLDGFRVEIEAIKLSTASIGTLQDLD